MSTGESDYAKRVVELSMQLANSRADVENLRMRIKAVDKEHEQLKKDRADMVDRFDAALRRAKAEVLELAARELCMYCNDPGNWAPMSNSGYHQCNTPGPNMTRCGATKIHALRRELDARAAQIEEGSKYKA